MKYFIASDIHGSYIFCKKMVEKFEKSNADKLILLGDILYHGPRNDLPQEYNPKKVIEILNKISQKIICVRGNCDAEVDQMVLDFPILCENSSIFIENKNFYLTHGHHFERINLQKGDTVIFGHTHIPKYEKENEILYINPGSVSIPKENSPHSYIIFENNEFSFYNLETNEIYRKERI
ncbi:MAG: phosphodiesterase [Clostridia bacterium]|nr:phosphodiesterase [Clostridia bacterium]